jgi:hypothetical protein
MVTLHLWLGRRLIDQLDRADLEWVAEVSEPGGVYRVKLRPGRALDELALLPILPVESARIRIV